MISIEGKYNKDCKIYADTIEDEAIALIKGITNERPFENQKIRIMPDVHAGKGIVIGFTSTLGDYVCPSHVGVDIGCQMTTLVFSKKVPTDKIPLLENRIKRDIPMGFTINQKKMYEDKDFYKFLNNAISKARASWADMIDDIYVDDSFIEKMLKRIGMDEKIFYKSICSVGGGNHYLEYGEVENSDKGYFTIHCGSRNFGVKICNYWTKQAESKGIDKKLFRVKLAELKESVNDKSELPTKIEELKKSLEPTTPNGYLGGEFMRGYLTDMVVAQAYASYNHKCIADKVYEIYDKTVGGCKLLETINTIHNYINFDDHIIRKGSIKAYNGEQVIIPFNMRDGVAICRGKGNPDWNYSAPHGCGRIMSRSKARKEITLEDYKSSMEGIYTTCINNSTIDEAPMVYKDKDEILRLIEPTVEVLYIIKPIINLKASED